MAEDYERRLKEQALQIDAISQLQAKQPSLNLSAGEAAQTTVGSLKVYELAIGAIFVAVLLNMFLSFLWDATSSKSRRRKADPMDLDRRKKPVTVTGPYIVYMLSEPNIIDDWTTIKKSLSGQRKKLDVKV